MGDEPVDRGHERRVLQHIAQWGPLTARAIGDGLMLSSEVVERVVGRLLLVGRISIDGQDRYGAPCYAA